MRCGVGLLAIALLVSPFAVGQDKAASEVKKTGFERFELVYQRNIFDPERRPPPRPEERVREEPPAAPRVERLGLVGVYIDKEQHVALFGGSSSTFNVTLENGSSIADFQILAITTDQVTLKKDDREIELRVGAGLEKRENEDWQLASGPVVNAGRGDSTAGSSRSAAPSGGGTDAERQETLRKMMERRRQETGR